MELLPALVGGLIGGLLGAIVGGLVSTRIQSRELPVRRSGQALARRPTFAFSRGRRAQALRAAAYQDVAVFSYWATDYVARTKPIVEPAPSSPDALPEDQIRALHATVALHASPEVQELALAMNERLHAFHDQADMLDKAHVTGQDPLEAWRAVTASRDAFYEAAEALRTRMAEELRQD